MIERSDITIVIPARYASVRFPGKPLADIDGTSMVRRVYERCAQSTLAGGVVVATDDERIADAVRAFGGNAAMTPPELASGTERMAWVARNLPGALFVNVQGDEPLIDPAVIDAAVTPMLADAALDIGTAASPIEDDSEFSDPNIVKIAMTPGGRALYFSRAGIPFPRDGEDDAFARGARLRHVGIYAFRRAALERFAALPPSPLERIEKLEQLRALEDGMHIHVALVASDTIAVDVPADVAKVIARLRAARR
ncbi:MAG: 3-deoxy-manno-octulosonate cytidylyltransferase [Ignavibacteria bacterium]|nr:3-deoxy-manno-octulosonate cytidylyltransferase [Ignavibacteria bacterium]